ncbi:FG-GAP-like repeat-containing protein [Hymenobacter sp. GOD-10R]|uniref:FG-GAP-like repeat-containing protein n=1 Tax=Hymenobacter sp. GOD-10R TaxID=3093922 RepID=UPI002D795264|nr:FG-GAP-like repeat-containing protein [Hymenobacter sp. GOD-10R]WRQ28436.1 FG-GAP-like repeat-containing protein [Hymenobacter sp. GOD-10R]
MIRTPTFTLHRGSIIQKSWLGLSAALLLTANSVYAQAPTVTNLTPARNARSAPRTTDVVVGFSQTLSNTAATQGALKVFSAQAGGKKAGIATVSGNTLTFNPSADFKAGETVFATVTAGAQSTSGTAITPHVFEFTTATSPSTGILAGGLELGLQFDNRDVALGDLDGDGDLDIVSCYGTSDPIPGVVVVRLNAGNGYFTDAQDVRVGTNPFANILADVDGDGDLDLLTGNSRNNITASTVSIRKNDGNGNFSGTQDVVVGPFPNSLAVGDLDGDGDLDFVIASNRLSVRLNDGNGTFDGTTEITTGVNSPQFVAARDLDGDGDLDLISANGDNTVSVLLNDGKANFSKGSELAMSSYSKLAFGDVDADGDLDFVATGSGTRANTLNIHRNDGTGTFSSAQQLAANRVMALSLNDMDGDGDLDLVTAEGLNIMAIRLNDGTGIFGNSRNASIPDGPISLAVGDMNGDGSLDAVATCSSSFYRAISIRLNQDLAVSTILPVRNARSAPRSTDVAATFNQPLANNAVTLGSLKVFSHQSGGKKAGTAAVNGNTLAFNPSTDFKAGETVLATLTAGAQSSNGAALATPQVFQFTTATSPSTGRFNQGPDFPVDPNSNPYNLATGDVDGDGDLDILTANFGGSVSVLLNNGSGSYASNQSVPVASATLAIVLANLDGDGDLDFATANGLGSTGTVSIRLNNGSGTFSGTTTITTGYRSNGAGNGLVAGDVDGDGDLDLLTSYLPNSTNTNNGLVGVLLNNGSASFTVTQQVTTPPLPYEIALGDIDNDGDLDLLAASSSTVSVRLNNGKGTFATSGEQVSGGGTVLPGDLNADGYLDFVTFENGNNLGVRLGNGTGAFNVVQSITQLGGITDPALGDVDGDGDLDVVDVSRNANGADVYFNNGTAIFSPSQFLPVGQSPYSVALGDVDNDGTLDLLAANYTSQTVSVRLNKTVLATAPAQLAEQVSVYPNPAHSMVHLRLPTELAQQRLQVRVLNALSQVVLTQTLATQATPELALPHLAAGLYTLQLQTNKGIIVKRLAVE